MGLIKQMLAENRLVRVFSLGRLVNPVVIDMFGLAGGFHGFWLDQEHAGLSYESIQLAALAARANELDCFVRLAPTNYSRVTQALEAGSGGVMAARIDTADQAREFVEWAKFAPEGSRGFNTSGRDALYTHKSPIDFAADANRDHFVAIQIETLGALAAADEIASIDGVDQLFIGPADLSQAMGILGQFESPRIWQAVADVSAACKKHGKTWGTVPAGPQWAERAYDQGCRLLTLGADVLAVRRGIEVAQSQYERIFQLG